MSDAGYSNYPETNKFLNELKVLMDDQGLKVTGLSRLVTGCPKVCIQKMFSEASPSAPFITREVYDSLCKEVRGVDMLSDAVVDETDEYLHEKELEKSRKSSVRKQVRKFSPAAPMRVTSLMFFRGERVSVGGVDAEIIDISRNSEYSVKIREDGGAERWVFVGNLRRKGKIDD